VAQKPLQEYLGTLKIQQVEWSIPKGGATMWALGFAHAVAELLLPRGWHKCIHRSNTWLVFQNIKSTGDCAAHEAGHGMAVHHQHGTMVAALQLWPQAQQPVLLSPATGVPADLSAAATRGGAWL